VFPLFKYFTLFMCFYEKGVSGGALGAKMFHKGGGFMC